MGTPYKMKKNGDLFTPCVEGRDRPACTEASAGTRDSLRQKEPLADEPGSGQPFLVGSWPFAENPGSGHAFLVGKRGGGGGIRTPETLTGLTVFKTAGLNRSPTPPQTNYIPQE